MHWDLLISLPVRRIEFGDTHTVIGLIFEEALRLLVTTALLAAAPDLMYSTSKLTISSLFLDSSESHSIPLWVVDIDLSC